MKKNVLFITILLVIFAALSFMGYRYFTEKPLEEITDSPSMDVRSSALENDFIEVPVLTFITEAESNIKQRYTTDISYPSIALVGHGNLAREANVVIKTFVTDLVREFQENVLSESFDQEEDLTTKTASDFTMRSNATLLSPTIVSLRFDTAEYIAGSAHPNQRVHILNYDLETHRIISTEDLFASTSMALPFLSEYARGALRKKMSDMSDEEFSNMTLAGTAPTRENFLAVGITKDGLSIVFNPYQVAEYARGAQEIHVPLSLVSTQLNPRIIRAIEMSVVNFKEATPE